MKKINPLLSKRRTLEWKLARRAKTNKANGMPENWASEALDCYLEGMNLSDIAKIMGVSHSAVNSAVAKEALFRLMKQRAVERLEEMDDLRKEKP